MPSYIFQHPKTKKMIEVVQKMTDVHEYIDDKGVKYIRVFTTPRMAVDTHIDPFSKKDFMRRTNKRMTVGDMFDESAILSEKREKKMGKDPFKEGAMAAYEKKTRKPHPERRKQNRRVETKNFVMEI